MNKQNMIKNGSIGIILIIVIFFAFKFLTPSSTSKSPDGEASSENVSSPVNTIISVSDVELLREKLNGIKVNTEIFSNKDFSSLKDYRVVVKPEPIGRDNPFSKI